MLGHTDPAFTARTYIHSSEDQRDRAALDLGAPDAPAADGAGNGHPG